MPERALIIDACIVITFGREQQLEVVTAGPRRIVIGDRARDEVERRPAKSQLDEAVRNGSIDVESIDLDEPNEQEALARYDGMPAFEGRGDAEVIALAVSRGYIVASDDRAIRRQVRRDLGPESIAGTLDLIVWAVREGRLELDSALAFLETCDVGPALLEALKAQGTSLEDLV